MAALSASSVYQSASIMTRHPPADLTPSSAQVLLSTLSSSSHSFLQPTPSLHTAACVLAKRYLDPLAISTSKTQEKRIQEARKKRKRGHDDDDERRKALKLKEVHLEGFGIEQVWEQARRVLDASRQEVERCLPATVTSEKGQNGPAKDGAKQIKSVRFHEEGLKDGSDLDEDASEAMVEENGVEEDVGDDDGEAGDVDEADALSEDGPDDGENVEEEGSDPEMEDGSDGAKAKTFIKDKHGLNDGFFNIDEFNRNTDFLEQADARGDDDDAASDEEDIDWDADPVGQPAIKVNGISSRRGNTQEESSDEEDGPTFGNANLNAPFSSDEEEAEDGDIAGRALDPTLSNTNDIHYADFFAPPPRALTKSTRLRPLPKTQPVVSQPIDADIQRTINSVRRDLFEDELSAASETPSDVEASVPANTNLSTHEKRRLALAKQIRELEAAAIAKREWTLSGEVSAHARPLNSLLEEDLDFERTGKPVPVITAAVSEDIEALIKRRILSRDFDEVTRRRPGADGPPAPRRGLLELSDTKDPQSLAERYEQRHLAATDPNAVDPRNDALKGQHAEIVRLWADVSAKLDALSNWRYKPKPPGVEVHVVTDAPRVLMEDARPSGVEGVRSEEGGLAPQEVYTVGKEREEGVITTKGGAVAGKEELTREEKLRRRRRAKERLRKSGAAVEGGTADDSKGDAGKVNAAAKKSKKTVRKDEQADVLKQLRSGGVRVIGKSGEVRDVDGIELKGGKRGGGGGAGGLKL